MVVEREESVHDEDLVRWFSTFAEGRTLSASSVRSLVLVQQTILALCQSAAPAIDLCFVLLLKRYGVARFQVAVSA